MNTLTTPRVAQTLSVLHEEAEIADRAHIAARIAQIEAPAKTSRRRFHVGSPRNGQDIRRSIVIMRPISSLFRKLMAASST